MSVKSVYVETSVVSYLVARTSRDLLIAACQQATKDWWLDCRSHYTLYTSQLVIAEAAAGDPALAKERLARLMELGELVVTNEARDLAIDLVAQGALPTRAEADALHISIAAVHRVDLLLTWNCRHIDNPATKTDDAARMCGEWLFLPRDLYAHGTTGGAVP